MVRSMDATQATLRATAFDVGRTGLPSPDVFFGPVVTGEQRQLRGPAFFGPLRRPRATPP